MVEQLILSRSAEQAVAPEQNQVTIASLGALVTGEAIVSGAREVGEGNSAFTTNLPENIDIFASIPNPPFAEAVLPNGLDELPVGEYWLSATHIDPFDDEPTPREYRRDLKVRETDKGKVVNVEAVDREWSRLPDPSAAKLMEALGYVIAEVDGHKAVTDIPTPSTFQESARAQGVEVEFFPDDEYIPGREYLRVFSEGKYPATTKTEGMYRHDISDDHITARVLGGDELGEALTKVTSEALKGDQEHIDLTAKLIDKFTATLRAVISVNPDFSGEAYSEGQGRATYLEAAQRLGIPAEHAQKILEVAQAKGREFGIDVKNLT